MRAQRSAAAPHRPCPARPPHPKKVCASTGGVWWGWGVPPPGPGFGSLDICIPFPCCCGEAARQAGHLLCAASALSSHGCWVMLGVLRVPASGEDGPWGSPFLQRRCPLSPPWSRLAPVQANSPRAPGTHSTGEPLWLKPGECCKEGRVSAVGLWTNGSLPSAALRPLPRRALLRGGRLRQEEVGADGFPQAQADGRVLLRWGRSL